MAKPTDYLGANVTNQDTFSRLVNTTNELVYDLATVVVTTAPVAQPNTVNGALTSGNAHVQGAFSANTLIASTALRGGSVSQSANLIVTSNAHFQGANVLVSDTTTSRIGGNVAFTTLTANNLSRKITIDFGNTDITQGLLTVSGNTHFNGSTKVVDVDTAALNITANTVGSAAYFHAYYDDVVIGDDNTDTLNVNAQGVFHANVTIGDDGTDYLLVNANTYLTSNVKIGDAASDKFTITSNTLFENQVTVGTDGTDTLTINSISQFNANSVIGSSSADTLTVEAVTTHNANVQVNGVADFTNNVVIGSSSADALDVNSVSDFNANVNIDGVLTATNNVVIGVDGTDQLTVNSNTGFTSNVAIGADATDILEVNSTSTFNNDLTIGEDAADQLNVNSTSVLHADVTIGDDGNNALVVNSSSDFNANVNVDGVVTFTNNAVIGANSSDSLTVNSVSDFNANVNIDADVSANANTTIGTDANNALVVNATSTFNNDVTVGSDATDTLNVVSTMSVQNDMTIGSDATDDLVVNSNTGFVNGVTIGSDATDALLVNSVSTLQANATVNGIFNTTANTILGTSGANALTVNALSTFNANTTIAADRFTVNNNATIGTLPSNSLTLNANTSVVNDMQIGSDGTKFLIIRSDTDIQNDLSIGQSATDNLVVNSNTVFNNEVTIGSDITDALNIVATANADLMNVNEQLFANNVILGNAVTANSQMFVYAETRFIDADVTMEGLGKTFFIDGMDSAFVGNVTISPITNEVFTVNSATSINANLNIGASSSDILTVYSNAFFVDNVDITASLVVDDNVTLGSDAADLLDVKATSVFDAPVTINSNAILKANVTIGDNSADALLVKATPTFETGLTANGNVSIEGDFAANGSVSATGDLAVSANASVGGALSVTGNTALSANLSVTGSSTFTNTATFNGVTTHNANVAINGTSTLTGDVTINGSLTGDDVTISGNLVPSAANTTVIGSALAPIKTIHVDQIVSTDGFKLTSLTDVEDATPAAGQILVSNTSGQFEFVDNTTTLLELDDTPSAAVANQVLIANTSGGFEFTPIVRQLQELNNVSGTYANGQTLVYNSTSNTFEFETPVRSVFDLSDVVEGAEQVANGQVLAYIEDSNGFEFLPVQLLANNFSFSLDDLTDVEKGGTQTGTVLVANSSNIYAPVRLELNALVDVNATATNGQVLTANSTGGFQFTTIETALTLGELTDVDATATTGQLLSANTTGGFEFINPPVVTENIDDLTDGYSDGASLGLGVGALNNDDGSSNYNVAVGYRALFNNTTGNSNIGLGANAGDNLTSGFNNIVIGHNSDASSATASNEITLGNNTITRMRVPGVGIDANTTVASFAHNVDITGNLSVDGDFVVTGNVVSVSVQELKVEDNLIYLNANAATANPDLGWVGAYFDGSYGHAGLFRDASDGVFKVFEGYTPEPDDAPTIDTAHPSFTLATIEAGGFIGDVTGQVSNIANHSTDNLAEGSTNLYYTNARARNAVSASGDLSYNSTTGVFSFTDRTNAEVQTLARTALSVSGDIDYNNTTGVFSVTTYKSADFDTDFASKSTTNLSEGTNLYYTNARARNAVSASGDLSYNSTTGVFSVTTYKDADVESYLSGGTGVTFSSGAISIGQDVATTANVTFNVVTATDFDSTSDARFKENVQPIENALDKVKSVSGYTFNFIGQEERSAGVIAQEIEKVLPEVVHGNEDKKTVAYGNMVALLIEAVKELSEEVNALKNELGKK